MTDTEQYIKLTNEGHIEGEKPPESELIPKNDPDNLETKLNSLDANNGVTNTNIRPAKEGTTASIPNTEKFADGSSHPHYEKEAEKNPDVQVSKNDNLADERKGDQPTGAHPTIGDPASNNRPIALRSTAGPSLRVTPLKDSANADITIGSTVAVTGTVTDMKGGDPHSEEVTIAVNVPNDLRDRHVPRQIIKLAAHQVKVT